MWRIFFCIGVDGGTDKDTLQGISGGKWEVKFWKKPKDLNATWQSQRRHQMRVYIWLTGFFLILEQVAVVLEKFKSLSTIKAVLVDNTNANTGWEGGLVTLLEKKIKRNLHTIGCSLHQNELPFRALFKHLDGTTKSPTTFNGPLGKLCANDCHNIPQKSFSADENPLEFHFGMKDMDSLSSDQDYSMNIQLVFLEVR